ncbi:MAG: hypothetical protein QM487_04130 [Candidatus Marithrix sp.]
MITDLNKYSKKIENIKCFIVNVYDIVNFDIDIRYRHNMYDGVLKNTYLYYDIDYHNLINIDNDKIIPVKGTTYRCRLRGIKLKRKVNYECVNLIMRKIRQLIDQNNGFVLCNLHGIDIYHRLLVDILVKIPKDDSYITVNLYNYLMDNFSDSGLIYSYDNYKQ